MTNHAATAMVATEQPPPPGPPDKRIASQDMPRLEPPMPDHPPYFERLAAAYVRGKLTDTQARQRDATLFGAPLASLSEADSSRLVAIGVAHGLRLHRFKRTMGLPRVRKVLGMLHSIQPTSVLDIGSGRGAFL